MDRKKKYYYDVLSAIELIEEFAADIKSLSDYNADKKTRSAVERQLVIIGEATKRIKDLNPDEVINHHKSIIGFRNAIVHSYDSIENEMVYSIIRNHLAPLKEAVIAKLALE